MFGDVPRLARDPAQEPTRLKLLERAVPVRLSPAAEELVHEPSVLTEPLAVRRERQRLVPPDELAAHHEARPVGVYRAACVEQRYRVLDRAQDDERLAEQVKVHNVA